MSARYLITLVAVGAAYVVGGTLGLDLAFANSTVTAVWPPTGIALAALVLGGLRLWPAVAVGALLTNVNTDDPAVTVALIAAGNTLEAVVGAYLLRRVGFRPSLQRVGDVMALVGLAAVLSTAVSASVGLAALLAGGEVAWPQVPSVWRTWWLGDMGGDLLIAPAILVIARVRELRRPPGHPTEAIVLAGALVVVTLSVFSSRVPLLYVLFPFVVWAALRFWRVGAVVSSLIVATIAVAYTAKGLGPFSAVPGPDEQLLLAQTFVAVACISSLVLAVVTAQRREAEESLREVATTLQESLLPPTLPDVPTIETATYFRPAVQGALVGGDFYDVFQVGSRSWAVAIGDVCGKGADAAALTALARYTLRTAGVREREPGRVLAALNDSVRRVHHTIDLCTAVYARLDLNGGPAAVTLASAGHPLPLILRTDGGVDQVGEPGMLLGADPEPPLPDSALTLSAGETLVFYTDGLIDAYAPGRVVRLEELKAALAPCAALEPGEIVSAITSSLLDGADRSPRDDIAIVVLQLRA